MKKRSMSILLCIVAVVLIPVKSFSMEPDYKESLNQIAGRIGTSLETIEIIRNDLALKNVAFETVLVGEPIQAYEINTSGLNRIREYYPLFENDKLIALATLVSDDIYQISTQLCEELDVYKGSNIALLYDVDTCYIVCGENDYEPICKFTPYGDTRIKLNTSNRYNISLTYLQPNAVVPYVPIDAERGVTAYIACNVSFVPQTTSNICWAASMAMIDNYLNSHTYTAESMAKYIRGSILWDNPLNITQTAGYYRTKLSLFYDERASLSAADSNIFYNISNSYPIHAQFSVSNGANHVVVIYGVNATSGYITLKDPEYGTITCYSTGGVYSYVRVDNSYTYTMDKLVTRLWSTNPY